jgi:cytochrome bd-type quinol oxidase subunit 2
MPKNKLIALAIILVLIFLPFQTAFVDFSVETQLLQVLTMAVVVIGSIIAIILFNRKEEGSSHH